MKKKLIFLGLFAFSMGLSPNTLAFILVDGGRHSIVADGVESKNTQNNHNTVSNPISRNT